MPKWITFVNEKVSILKNISITVVTNANSSWRAVDSIGGHQSGHLAERGTPSSSAVPFCQSPAFRRMTLPDKGPLLKDEFITGLSSGCPSTSLLNTDQENSSCHHHLSCKPEEKSRGWRAEEGVEGSVFVFSHQSPCPLVQYRARV